MSRTPSPRTHPRSKPPSPLPNPPPKPRPPSRFPRRPPRPPLQKLAAADLPDDEHLPPPPTAEQTDQANRAYNATVDRLDTAIRATNPGMERMPEMNYDRLVQSLYMQALLQLGGATEPGQPAQVDILGARQTIDMLSVIAEKSKGNLTDAEDKLTQSALFELRMGFLEVTQAIARQAAKQGAPGVPPAPGGPSLIR